MGGNNLTQVALKSGLSSFPCVYEQALLKVCEWLVFGLHCFTAKKAGFQMSLFEKMNLSFPVKLVQRNYLCETSRTKEKLQSVYE